MRYKLNVICVVNVLYSGFLQLCGPASCLVVVDDGARWLAPTSATPLLHTTVRQEESSAAERSRERSVEKHDDDDDDIDSWAPDPRCT